jgi:hypothetical protein
VSHMRREGRVLWGIALATLLVLPGTIHAQELAISNVRPNSIRLDPAKGETLRLSFQLSVPAQVTLQVYDGRELLVHEIKESELASADDRTMTWDLRDHAGKVVPPEAYTYALEAQTKDGKAVRYDLADATGGQTVATRDVRVDKTSGTISYVIDRPARVNVRMGLDNAGPLLRTLIDWVVRPAGQQVERWNGKDASEVLDLAAHPRLFVSVQAFSLPDNSILVGESQQQVQLISGLPAQAQRQKNGTQAKRMYSHAQQPLESRGDFKVLWTLPKLPRSATGVPIVTSVTPVRLDVQQADRERALSRRFEPVFFIDGQFAFENEVGFVPMTWNFDPAALNEGEHFLTVNLRGYEGNFGMATLKVFVQRPAAPGKAKQ